MNTPRRLLWVAAALVAGCVPAFHPKPEVIHYCTCDKPCPPRMEFDRFIVVTIRAK